MLGHTSVGFDLEGFLIISLTPFGKQKSPKEIQPKKNFISESGWFFRPSDWGSEAGKFA